MRLRFLAIPVLLAIAGCAGPAPADSHTAAVSSAKSIRTLERQARSGDTKAQVELGRRYGAGDGVPQDYAKALELLRAAAEKDDPTALYYVGTAYEHGAGVPKDDAQAVIWYERATALRERDAAFTLAMMIIEGKGGIVPSWPGAMPPLTIAAEEGLVKAQYALANAYATGFGGVEKNSATAAYWYRKTITETSDNAPAVKRLRLLINRGDVQWQPGDPGEDPARLAPEPNVGGAQ